MQDVTLIVWNIWYHTWKANPYLKMSGGRPFPQFCKLLPITCSAGGKPTDSCSSTSSSGSSKEMFWNYLSYKHKCPKKQSCLKMKTQKHTWQCTRWPCVRHAIGKINSDIPNGLQTVWTSVKAGNFSSVWYHTTAQRHSCLQYQELIASSDKGIGAHMAGRGQRVKTGVTNWWYVRPLPSSSSAPCSGRRCPLLWSRLPAP